MPICRHGKEMRLEGDKWVCDFGCIRDVIHKIPAQAELWKEVKSLREEKAQWDKTFELIAELYGVLDELIHGRIE